MSSPEQFLPIDSLKKEFLAAIKSHATLLVSAQPGAGKSTRLPLWLLEKGTGLSGKVYLLQPRRVAVKNIAQYLAEQLGEGVGQRVGYRIRNEAKVSSHTQLEVVTEGVLVRMMQEDPELLGTSIVILDEFHERSLQTDLAYALARDIQQGLRDDLTLVIMSATLSISQLQQAIPDAYYLFSEGRSFPVEVSYSPANNMNRWRDHALQVIKQQINETDSSILVFLPSSNDIRFLHQALEQQAIDVFSLFGYLSIDQQMAAIKAPEVGQRKLVLATNIAETSLTIDGINLVIDSGLENIAVYDEGILANKLVQRQISKSSAIQRAGRAGRTAPGTCIRLYSEALFERATQHNGLAIEQSDVVPIVLEAARWGVSSLSEMPFIDLPKEMIEQQAWQTLHELKMVDDNQRLTVQGERGATIPCHPRFAHMILAAEQLEQSQQVEGLVELACVVTSLLEAKDIFSVEQARDNSDLVMRLHVLLKNWHQGRYQQITKQAEKLAGMFDRQIKITQIRVEHTGVLLAFAYPERVAKKRKNQAEYLTASGKGLSISNDDPILDHEWLVAAHVSKQRTILKARLVATVELEQLIDWQVVTLEEKLLVNYDEIKQAITSKAITSLGAIVVSDKPIKIALNDAQLSEMWLTTIRQQGIHWLNWQEKDKQLLARWRWLNRWQNQLDFPDVCEEKLLASLEQWLAPFLLGATSKKTLDSIDLSQALLTLLSYAQQQQLDQAAPVSYRGATGRKCPINYSDEQHPIVSLPVHELYGCSVGPSVGEQQAPILLTLEMLSPAQRPVQVTKDLAGFWCGSYAQVQKDMKSRYPKHYWPDDPANSPPRKPR
ncbi:ATP-dependent helicase HrpB [Thalassotalea marina]|uniref:ATP-dependent RNA helicase HrpB n=1 Tax=Thalassotalea marina TaxID=1673741 RepID=A0A919BQR8_9GAMM|nr:ATP-dependent helicase HrpB [Thalassotalea marina]GHG04614.1 ATP-dependent RNA helicase HrpB [Thalassotalea marina]